MSVPVGEGHQVFISYAWATRRESALALAKACREAHLSVFLDSFDIEPGADIPSKITRALAPAGVVAVLADETYFTRPYCLEEFATALDHRGWSTLRSIILALGTDGSFDMSLLPPALRNTLWPTLSRPATVVALIKERLRGPTVAEAAATTWRIQVDGDEGDAAVSRLPTSLGKRFIGRDHDLWRIHFELARRARQRRRASVAVIGTAGVGKTRMAIEYAQRHAAREFTGGVFWLDASLPAERVDQQLHDILTTLDGKARPLAAYRQRADPALAIEQDVERALRAHGRPVLFIVDNVPEAVDEARTLARYGCGVAHVLATSRRNLAVAEPEVVGVPLDGLDRVSSAELLVRDLALDERGQPADWSEIAAWVGDLPIALDLLNRALVSRAISRRELVAFALHQDAVQMVDEQYAAIRELVPAGAVRGVGKTFELSFSLLDPAQQRSAQLLAWLAPVAIPDSLLGCLEPLIPRAHRAVLAARSFVTPAHAPVPSYGRMHRLDRVRSARGCRERGAPAPRGSPGRSSGYRAALVASAWPRARGTAQGPRGTRRVATSHGPGARGRDQGGAR